MILSLDCNAMRGDWSFADAEARAAYLVSVGRAIPADQWVDGLIVRNRQLAQGSVLEGLI